MSMSANVKPWLWELLNWDCGEDEGRLALIRAQNIVVGSLQVITNTGSWHQIKIISSACTSEQIEREEVTVVAVSDRRETRGRLEYFTHWSDGDEDWVTANQFIDADGATNLTWLHFATEDDLSRAFSSYTQAQLKIGHVHSTKVAVDWRQIRLGGSSGDGADGAAGRTRRDGVTH